MSLSAAHRCRLIAFALCLSGATLARADNIALTLASGSVPTEALLSWSGGTSPYQVHRASAPAGLEAPAHVIGLAASGGVAFSDAGAPAVGDIYFYAVVSGQCGDAVVDIGEGCDDGGTNPGDGCSAACQTETPASLVLSPGLQAFGDAFVGGTSATASFTLTNQGDMTSGALSIGLNIGDTGDFALLAPVAGDCVSGTGLPGHSACTIQTRFTPQTPGAKGTTLSISAAPGGSPQATLSGIGKWRLVLNRTGAGSLTRDGVPVCAGACPEEIGYPDGATVNLAVAPLNASGSYFGGWSGDCAGITRGCAITMTGNRTATAAFVPMTYNLAFVSSATLAGNLGSPAAYDVQCNALATTAGLNNVTGTAFIAWIASSTSSPPTRLSPGSGWVRMDGRPFATSAASLTSGLIVNPLRLDEYGVDVGARAVMTGSSSGGTALNTCVSWTSNAPASLLTIGDASYGPGGWSSLSNFASCATTRPVYCLMKTKTVGPSITPEAGKRIYLSGAYVPGPTTTPDQRCDLDKPSGMGSVRALVATTTTAAASALVPAQRYVRVDGSFIGTGADIAAGGSLTTGMWVLAGGTYAADSQRAWTGATTPGVVGTAATTCADWSSTGSTGLSGAVNSSDTSWWGQTSAPCTTTSFRLYCVEQ